MVIGEGEKYVAKKKAFGYNHTSCIARRSLAATAIVWSIGDCMKHKQTESLGQGQMRFCESPQAPHGFIGYLQVGIFIAQSQSLKDRRRVVERIKQKAKNNFNISVGEKPCQMWKNCELFFICANYTKQYVLETIDRLEEFIRSYNDVQIVAIEKGVL